jgi:hypothetical protein
MIKAEINLEELEELEGKILKIAEADTLLRTVSFGVFALMKRRIHTQGKKSDGNSIGTYSSGYLEWRLKNNYAAQGSTVKLFLTGQMQNDFSVGKLNDNNYGIGFQNKFNYDKSVNAEDGQEPHTVKPHTRKIKKPTKDGKSVVDVKSYINKGWEGYGRIYDLTNEEKEAVSNIVKDFIEKNLL